MKTALQQVTLQLVRGNNYDHFVDVKGLHRDIEMPDNFKVDLNGHTYLVSTLKGVIEIGMWDKRKYQRISIVDMTESMPFGGGMEFTIKMELPVIEPKKKFKQIKTPGTYEVMVTDGGSYYAGGSRLALADGEEKETFFSCEYPVKGRAVGTGEEVIITTSSHEVRGGHGEGNSFISTVQVTSLDTMKPMPKETRLLVQGFVYSMEEVKEE